MVGQSYNRQIDFLLVKSGVLASIKLDDYEPLDLVRKRQHTRGHSKTSRFNLQPPWFWDSKQHFLTKQQWEKRGRFMVDIAVYQLFLCSCSSAHCGNCYEPITCVRTSTVGHWLASTSCFPSKSEPSMGWRCPSKAAMSGRGNCRGPLFGHLHGASVLRSRGAPCSGQPYQPQRKHQVLMSR